MKIATGLAVLIQLTVLISCVSSGQGVRLKKDILYVDNIATPIRIDMEYKTPKDFYAFHQSYTFFDGDAAVPFLIVDYKGVLIPGSHEKTVWLEISDAERARTNSVNFKAGFIFSKNVVIKEMINTYQFFNRSGNVHYDRIAKFMTTDVQADAKNHAEGIFEKKRRDSDLLHTIDPFVTQDLIVTKGGILGEPIGRLEILHDNRPEGSFMVGVYDLAENQIASSKVEPHIPMVEVSLVDGRRFEYYTHYGLSVQIGGAGFMYELVEQVLLKGFSLGYSYDESMVTNNESEAYETH